MGGFSDFFSAIFGDLMSKGANAGYQRTYSTGGFNGAQGGFSGSRFGGFSQNMGGFSGANQYQEAQRKQKPAENLDITQNIILNVNDIFLAGSKA